MIRSAVLGASICFCNNNTTQLALRHVAKKRAESKSRKPSTSTGRKSERFSSMAIQRMGTLELTQMLKGDESHHSVLFSAENDIANLTNEKHLIKTFIDDTEWRASAKPLQHDKFVQCYFAWTIKSRFYTLALTALVLLASAVSGVTRAQWARSSIQLKIIFLLKS